MLDVKCPYCGKRIAKTDFAVSSHFRSKIHSGISAKEKQRMRHEIINAICEKGTLSRYPSNGQEERKLTRDLGIS